MVLDSSKPRRVVLQGCISSVETLEPYVGQQPMCALSRKWLVLQQMLTLAIRVETTNLHANADLLW